MKEVIDELLSLFGTAGRVSRYVGYSTDRVKYFIKKIEAGEEIPHHAAVLLKEKLHQRKIEDKLVKLLMEDRHEEYKALHALQFRKGRV